MRKQTPNLRWNTSCTRCAHRLEVETETLPDGSSQVSAIHLVVTAGPAEFFKRFGEAE